MVWMGWGVRETVFWDKNLSPACNPVIRKKIYWPVNITIQCVSKTFHFETLSPDKYFKIFSGKLYTYGWIAMGPFIQRPNNLTICHALVNRGHFCERAQNLILTGIGYFVLAGISRFESREKASYIFSWYYEHSFMTQRYRVFTNDLSLSRQAITGTTSPLLSRKPLTYIASVKIDPSLFSNRALGCPYHIAHTVCMNEFYSVMFWSLPSFNIMSNWYNLSLDEDIITYIYYCQD